MGSQQVGSQPPRPSMRSNRWNALASPALVHSAKAKAARIKRRFMGRAPSNEKQAHCSQTARTSRREHSCHAHDFLLFVSTAPIGAISPPSPIPQARVLLATRVIASTRFVAVLGGIAVVGPADQPAHSAKAAQPPAGKRRMSTALFSANTINAFTAGALAGHGADRAGGSSWHSLHLELIA